MRLIEGTIFSHLNLDSKEKHEKIDIASTQPLLIENFKELVEKIATLSFHNKDFLLFFRGQGKDHLNRAQNSSFYPSIYRTNPGENLSKFLLDYRFRVLEQAAKLLISKFADYGIKDSLNELKRRKFIQWSILQHYEVCDTPLLDLTQSIRVACSFALSGKEEYGYVFVFGLPYITNRISINSEQDIVNIRLINICPPQALRPYFQEGYLVGTADITNDYDDRTELDFKKRLIAKFKIPNNDDFWGGQKLSRDYLNPSGDIIEKLSMEIISQLHKESNIQALFPGIWVNEYELADGRTGREILEIKNSIEYHTLGKHMFNLDSILIDRENGVLKFRKVGIGVDKRKAFNSLKIINENRYEGVETSNTKISYTRIQ